MCKENAFPLHANLQVRSDHQFDRQPLACKSLPHANLKGPAELEAGVALPEGDPTTRGVSTQKGRKNKKIEKPENQETLYKTGPRLMFMGFW